MVGYSNILTVAEVSVNNIGDNFLPTTAHTTTTPANVDVNILPNIILVIVNVDVNILPPAQHQGVSLLPLAASITLLDHLDPRVRGEEHQHARTHVPLQHLE